MPEVLEQVEHRVAARRAQARKTVADVARREVEGSAKPGDAKALEDVLLISDISPEEFSAWVAAIRKHAKLTAAAGDVKELEKKVVALAKHYSAFNLETHRLYRKRWDEDAPAIYRERIVAERQADAAKSAIWDLDLLASEYPELFQDEPLDLDQHELTCRGEVCAFTGALRLEVDYDTFRRELHKRRHILRRMAGQAKQHNKIVEAQDDEAVAADAVGDTPHTRRMSAPDWRDIASGDVKVPDDIMAEAVS